MKNNHKVQYYYKLFANQIVLSAFIYKIYS